MVRKRESMSDLSKQFQKNSQDVGKKTSQFKSKDRHSDTQNPHTSTNLGKR